MAVHLVTYYAINAVYILQHFKQLTTVGMLLLVSNPGYFGGRRVLSPLRHP